MASKRGLKERPPTGTRVRFTGYFLRSTGQQVGSEGSKRFTVVECHADDNCLCKGGGFLAVDERPYTATGYEDIAPEVLARWWRHINLGNLEIVGASPKAADQADALLPIKQPLGDPPR